MFIRPCFRKKNGKRHAYWALVESYRSDRGPRQRVVAYLGQLKDPQRRGVKRAAQGKTKTPYQQLKLFGTDAKLEPEWVEVDTANVRVENQLDFGGPWLALELMCKLQLDKLFEGLMPRGGEDIPWAKMASVLTISRLCNPSSELFIAEHYYRSTAMPELLGIPSDKINQQRLYRALDKLLPHKEAAFRIHKGDLRLRPVWHQKEDRVKAHILVCFLAYVSWKTLHQMTKAGGLGDEPRRIFETLGKISLVDVVLPTRGGPEIRRRCIRRPTDHQAILLDRLSLTLPRQLTS